MEKNLATTYDPKQFEDRIYEMWEKNGAFKAEADPDKKPFTIVMPPPNITGQLHMGHDEKLDIIKGGERYIKDLANITDIRFISDKKDVPEDVMSAVIDGIEIFIPLEDLVDFAQEAERLEKEKARLEGEVKRVRGKLSNQGFVAKAPESVVNEEREKQVKYEDMLAKVTAQLEIVKGKVK